MNNDISSRRGSCSGGGSSSRRSSILSYNSVHMDTWMDGS